MQALSRTTRRAGADALVVGRRVTICLVILTELNQVVESAVGLAASRLGKLDAEVVVVVFLLEARDIELQGG